jgi:hypothetical protein
MDNLSAQALSPSRSVAFLAEIAKEI